MSYLDWVTQVFPVWLRWEPGDGYTDTLATLVDSLAQSTEDAISCRDINSDTVDSLDYVSLDRRLPRHPDLSNDTFRTYAGNTFNQWQRAGTVDGIVFCLESCGFSDITVCEGTDPFWAALFGLEWWQFVLLVETVPTGVLIPSPSIYGVATYTTTYVYGAITEFGKTMLKQAANQFKSSHSQCLRIGVYSPDTTDFVYFRGE